MASSWFRWSLLGALSSCCLRLRAAGDRQTPRTVHPTPGTGAGTAAWKPPRQAALLSDVRRVARTQSPRRAHGAPRHSGRCVNTEPIRTARPMRRVQAPLGGHSRSRIRPATAIRAAVRLLLTRVLEAAARLRAPAPTRRGAVAAYHVALGPGAPISAARPPPMPACFGPAKHGSRCPPALRRARCSAPLARSRANSVDSRRAASAST
jgi:hypothetical protein